jgi:hypothetical protein
MLSTFFSSSLLPGRAAIAYARHFETFLIAAAMFFAAVYFCMPVASSPEVGLLYPWWAVKITFNNAQLYEAFFILWCIFFGRRLLREKIWVTQPSIKVATFVLVALALWCGLISMMAAPLPWLDAGRTFRLMLNAAMMCAVFEWSRKNSDMVLVALLAGFFVGTLINLFVSFEYPVVICGVMRMAGQNTPGVAMAFAVHIGAWLFAYTRSSPLKVFAMLTLPLFVFGSVFSASKTAWLIAAFGLVIWTYIFFTAKVQNQRLAKILQVARAGLLASVIIIPAYTTLSFNQPPSASLENTESSQYENICDEITALASGAAFAKQSSHRDSGFSSTPLHASPTFADTLFSQLVGMLMVKYNGFEVSGSIRVAYVIETLQIIAKHPLGVGYSGFYEHALQTSIYKSGKAAPEVSAVEANPHSSFLWYTTAGGIPGGAMAIALFILLLRIMQQSLVRTLGKSGYLFFAMAALSFLVIGLIVPYIFNSIIMTMPAAYLAGRAAREAQNQSHL